MHSGGNTYLHVAISDFKLIFRNPSLRIFLTMPFLAIIVVAWILPYLIEQYPAVLEYVPYIVMAATFQAATMFGFLYAMVFIDEKETGVNKVYGVLPLSKKGLVISRLVFPLLFSFVFTFAFLCIQPFYDFPLLYNAAISLLTGLMGPMFVLFVTNVSKNQMVGMTIFKGLNGLLNLPLLAFFIPASYAIFFGIIPSHWTFQEMNNFIFDSQLYVNLGIGYAVNLFFLVLLVIQFSKKHFQ